MLLNSYVKRGHDMVFEYLSAMTVSQRYDLDMTVARYDIEQDRLTEWAEHGVEYSTMYFATLRKGGTESICRHDCSHLQRARHFARIRAIRALTRV